MINLGGSFSVRELKCGACGKYIRQKAKEDGSFDKVKECPNCKSTRIGTIRIYQSDK